MEKDYSDQFTYIWERYRRSREYLDKKDMVRKMDECWRFFIGDQWHGLESGGERLPMVNFIKPTIRYKTAVISQNSMVAVYSPKSGSDPQLADACDLLNEQFRQLWEKGKMDSKMWDIVTGAQIQGESYLYYGTPSDMEPQILPNVNVLLADEQEPNIQNQKYIMIYERRFVSDIRKEAKENGIPEDEIASIVSDEETTKQLGNITEIKANSSHDGKCESVLYMEKDENGVVRVGRSTKTCVYQPVESIESKSPNGEKIGIGLLSYPIVPFVWERMPNSARGNSEVWAMIPNQLEYNKTLARRSMAVKMCSYPRIAYKENSVMNPDALDSVGAKIKLQNMGDERVDNLIQYLSPQPISGDAKSLSDELISMTREVSGAGDIATGSVDPTKASGSAIIAVKNQNELPLNSAIATKTQFVEDLALLWFDLWVAYHPNGMEVEIEEKSIDEFGREKKEKVKRHIPADVLEGMKVDVRVDVSQANPFSKLAQEQALERILSSEQITFEEYIDALDDDSNVPKRKIKDILYKRAQMQSMQQQSQLMQKDQQLQQFAQLAQNQNQALSQLTGLSGAPADEMY